MNIHSLRLLQTELQPCIHDKKNYLGSEHSYEFSRATQRFPNPARTSYWHNRTSLNHFSGECWLWPLDLWNDFRHSLSIYIPFPQCAEKISSPPVKPLGVELNKLDYPLMSAYSVMNTGTRTPPALCHSHYSYTGQSYFDINLVGDRVNWRKHLVFSPKRSRLESLLDLNIFKPEAS